MHFLDYSVVYIPVYNIYLNNMSEQFSSQSTDSFFELLTLAKCSLIVTTYQAGQVVIVRTQNNGINTHFMDFDRPMGIARRINEFSIGGAHSITTFRNLAAVGNKTEQGDNVDACYLPRTQHFTGAIDIHEMGYDKNDKLWFINTKMSALATLDKENSFKVHWKPPFISHYDLTDRCHLNGLGFRNGMPRYVTMLGKTNTPGGWRGNKISGGQIMDINNNKVLCDGLCMPHSPRWYKNKLWFLSSGSGHLMRMSLGKAPEVVAELPGFARGLDFIDRYAIIGLSQVRESATFAGLPLTKRVAERKSGIWVVDIETSQIVAFLIFTGNVQEVFEVKVLAHKYPAIVDQTNPLLANSYELAEEILNNLAPVDPIQLELEQASKQHVEGNFKQAIKMYRQILSHSPKHKVTHHQLGICLVDAKRWKEAIEQLQLVIENQTDNVEAMNSLAVAYQELLDYKKSMQWFEQAIDIDKQFALGHYNRSMLLLKSGHYKEGFKEYEWRWQTPQHIPFQCDKPQWKGEDISDKRILIHSEQGNGDHIQYWRFLPLLAKNCKEIIYVGPENLSALAALIPGVSQSRVVEGLTTDLFDVFCPLMSLPNYLNIDETNLPAPQSYIKVPEQVIVSQLTGEIKIGLSWTGSFARKDNDARSIELDLLLPLVNNNPKIKFYSLQMPLTNTDGEILRKNNITNLETELPGYARTAALIKQMDLVITVDTAIAHLAGALGKPLWVLLHQNCDWRWQIIGRQSIWYPTARLFRQTNNNNWLDVINSVENELGKRYG